MMETFNFENLLRIFFSLRFEGEILALLEMFNSIMKQFQLNNFAECNLYMQKGIQYFNKKKEKQNIVIQEYLNQDNINFHVESNYWVLALYIIYQLMYGIQQVSKSFAFSKL